MRLAFTFLLLHKRRKWLMITHWWFFSFARFGSNTLHICNNCADCTCSSTFSVAFFLSAWRAINKGWIYCVSAKTKEHIIGETLLSMQNYENDHSSTTLQQIWPPRGQGYRDSAGLPTTKSTRSLCIPNVCVCTLILLCIENFSLCIESYFLLCIELHFVVLHCDVVKY